MKSFNSILSILIFIQAITSTHNNVENSLCLTQVGINNHLLQYSNSFYFYLTNEKDSSKTEKINPSNTNLKAPVLFFSGKIAFSQKHSFYPPSYPLQLHLHVCKIDINLNVGRNSTDKNGDPWKDFKDCQNILISFEKGGPNNYDDFTIENGTENSSTFWLIKLTQDSLNERASEAQNTQTRFRSETFKALGNKRRIKTINLKVKYNTPEINIDLLELVEIMDESWNDKTTFLKKTTTNKKFLNIHLAYFTTSLAHVTNLERKDLALFSFLSYQKGGSGPGLSLYGLNLGQPMQLEFNQDQGKNFSLFPVPNLDLIKVTKQKVRNRYNSTSIRPDSESINLSPLDVAISGFREFNNEIKLALEALAGEEKLKFFSEEDLIMDSLHNLITKKHLFFSEQLLNTLRFGDFVRIGSEGSRQLLKLEDFNITNMSFLPLSSVLSSLFFEIKQQLNNCDLSFRELANVFFQYFDLSNTITIEDLKKFFESYFVFKKNVILQYDKIVKIRSGLEKVIASLGEGGENVQNKLLTEFKSFITGFARGVIRLQLDVLGNYFVEDFFEIAKVALSADETDKEGFFLVLKLPTLGYQKNINSRNFYYSPIPFFNFNLQQDQGLFNSIKNIKTIGILDYNERRFKLSVEGLINHFDCVKKILSIGRENNEKSEYGFWGAKNNLYLELKDFFFNKIPSRINIKSVLARPFCQGEFANMVRSVWGNFISLSPLDIIVETQGTLQLKSGRNNEEFVKDFQKKVAAFLEADEKGAEEAIGESRDLVQRITSELLEILKDSEMR